MKDSTRNDGGRETLPMVEESSGGLHKGVVASGAGQILGDLHGYGVEVESDFILKAQLKLRVRPFDNGTAQDMLERMVNAYDERMALLSEDIGAILRRADSRKSLGLYVVQGGRGQGLDLFKAGVAPKQARQTPMKAPAAPKPSAAPTASATPKAPTAGGATAQRKEVTSATAGTRGGKFYITDSGKIRYGVKPSGAVREAHPHEVAEHYSHFNPTLFSGAKDEFIREAILDMHVGPGKLLSEDAANLIKAWDEAGLREAFLEKLGLEEEHLKEGLNEHFPLPVEDEDTGEETTYNSYEEAVADWFRSNLGEDEPGEIDAMMKDVMETYKKALNDPAVQKMAAARAEEMSKTKHKQWLEWESTQDNYDQLVNNVMSSPRWMGSEHKTIIAMGAMGLIIKPKTGQVGKGSGKAKGMLATVSTDLENKGWFYSNPEQREQLDRMSASQLQTMYIAAKLDTVFDGQSYKTTGTKKFGSSKLADHIKGILSQKLNMNDALLSAYAKNLDEHAELVAETLTAANNGENSYIRELVGLGSEALKDDSLTAGAREKIENFEQLKQSALEAQQNEVFDDLPESMLQGALGGIHGDYASAHESGDYSKHPSHMINKSTGKPWELFTHQKQSINWMDTVKRGVLALDAGMGKTPTVITFMEKLKAEGKAKRGILFLPPSLMAQWPEEIANFAPGAKDKVLSLYGLSLEERKILLQSEQAQNAEYIIISTGTLTDKDGGDGTGKKDKDADGTGGTDSELMGILKGLEGAVFIDEAHQGGYKTPGSVRHEMAKQIMGPEREYAFGMTATPMTNDPKDLYHLTNLFAPGTVGDLAEWEGHLHGTIYNKETDQWDVANPQNIVELNKRIKPFVFHKLITDPEVAKDMGSALPDLTHEHVSIEPDQTRKCPETGFTQWDYIRPGGVADFLADMKIAQIQEKRKEDGLEPLGSFVAQGLYEVTKMNIIRQAAISPAMVDPRYKGGATKIEKIADDVHAHFIGGAGAEDKPLVIFSSFPGKAFPLLREELKRRGIDDSRIGQIDGTKTGDQRAFAQDKTNSGEYKVLLVGTMSGGAGLNLQKKSNKMMFVDDPWNPAAKRQALGRVWRTGQAEATSAYTYRMAGSTDMDIEEKIANKQVMVTAMLGKPDPNIFGTQSKQAIEQLGGRSAGTSSKEAEQQRFGGGREAEYTSDQIAGLMRLVGDIDSYGIEDFGEDIGDAGIDPSKPETIRGPDKIFEDHVSKLPPVDKKKWEALKEHAPSTASKFDVASSRKEWQSARMKKQAKLRYDIKMTAAEAYEAKGDKAKADETRRQAERIMDDYPESFGKKPKPQKEAAAKKPAAKKPAAKKPAAKKETKTTSSTKQTGGAVAKKPANKNTVSHPGFGVEFAHKKSPFKSSGRKIRGTDITHAEADHFYDLMVKNPKLSLDKFAEKHVAPIWDEDEAGKYTNTKGRRYVKKVLDAMRSTGAIV